MRSSLAILQSDARLLDRIRDGEEEALVTLYNVNRRAIHAYVLRNSGTSDDAEDMLQEALVVLWERVRNGTFEQSARISTFLYAVVKNLWARRLAHRRRESPETIDPDERAGNNPPPIDALVEEETVARVQRALDSIGEPCKTLLILYYWDELTMAEIAEQLGYANADTAKAKKHQCKKMLANMLRLSQND